MIRKPHEQSTEVAQNLRGGEGEVHSRNLLNAPEEMNGKGRLFKLFTLPVGASIGYHPHNDETETYYITSGSGEYNDNGKIMSCSAGDILHTYCGDAHSIKNVGTTPLEFIALILFAD